MFKDNPYGVMLRLMRKYAPSRKKIIRAFSFFFVANIVRMFEPYVMGRIMTTLQLWGDEQMNQIITLLVILWWLPLIERIFRGMARLWQEDSKFEITKAFRLHLFKVVTSLSLSWHSDHHSGETIDKVNKASDALQEFAGNTYMYIGVFLTFLTSISMLIRIRPMAWVIIFVIALIMFWVIQKYDTILVKLLDEQNKLQHKISALTFDYLSNIKTVITLRFEERVRSVLRDAITAVFPVFKKYVVLNEMKRFTMNMLLTVVISTLLGLYIYQEYSMNGIVLVGTITMMFQYIQRMSDSLYNFAWQYSMIVQNKVNIQAVDSILSAYDEITQKHHVSEFSTWSRIDIQNLSFSYQNKSEKTLSTVLKNISFSLHAGEKIAFVGSSGSGKSTMMSLLRWLYDVENVGVTVDGKREDDMYVFAHHTSLIPQDPEIFENTIKYNITVGIEVADEKLERIMHLAAFKDVVDNLPNGLETDIREKGVNLSWGQKQRLALARGLLLSEDSDILLLDEPTSSVDPLTEQQIYTRIFEAYPQKTIVSALHKLHLVGLFDMIYVFDKWHIIEQWTFDQLVEKNWSFTKMRSAYQQGMRSQNS